MTNIIFTSAMQLILAACNQFAEKAEPDLPLPILQQDVTKVHGKAEIHGLLVFTVADRYEFAWQMTSDMRGAIVHFNDNKFASGTIEQTKFLPSLINVPSLITTNEAFAIADRCFKRLGYHRINKEEYLPPLTRQFTCQKNEKDVPMPVPLFGIRWLPKEQDTWKPYIVAIEVSGITKKVTHVNQMAWEETAIDLWQFMTNSSPAAKQSKPESSGTGKEYSPCITPSAK